MNDDKNNKKIFINDINDINRFLSKLLLLQKRKTKDNYKDLIDSLKPNKDKNCKFNEITDNKAFNGTLKKTHVISDVEGKIDYFISFLIQIKFFNEQKVKKLFKIDENTSFAQYCKKLYNNDNDENKKLLEEFINKIKEMKENDWLSLINPNFNERIIVNGDLISDRPEKKGFKKLISQDDMTNMNVGLMKMVIAIKENIANNKYTKQFYKDFKKDDFCLIGGNHELYNYDECIDEEFKQNFVAHNIFEKYRVLNYGDDKKIIFKHSPWIQKTDFNDIIQKQSEPINNFIGDKGDKKLHNFFTGYYKASIGDDSNTFTPEWEKICKENNKVFLFHGHSHETMFPQTMIYNWSKQFPRNLNFDEQFIKNFFQLVMDNFNKQHRMCSDCDIFDVNNPNKVIEPLADNGSLYFTIDKEGKITTNDVFGYQDSKFKYTIDPFGHLKEKGKINNEIANKEDSCIKKENEAIVAVDKPKVANKPKNINYQLTAGDRFDFIHKPTNCFSGFFNCSCCSSRNNNNEKTLNLNLNQSSDRNNGNDKEKK